MRLAFAASVRVSANAGRTVVDGVEYIVGKPIHIFPNGTFTAVDGRAVAFDEYDAKALIDEVITRDTDVALTYDHEQDKARGSESAGWMPRDAFVWRADGLWNTRPLWVVDVYEKLITTGKFRYLSGDALGIGSADRGDAFHPRRLLAASLVPKPGIVRGLQGITLSADSRAALDAWTKEEFAMGDETVKPHSKEDCTDPNCKMHEDEFCNDGKKKEAQMSATAGTAPGSSVPVATLEKEGAAGLAAKGLSAEEGQKFAAEIGEKIAAEVTPAAKKAAEEAADKLVKEQFAARETAEKIDKELAAAELQGKFAPADREHYRAIFTAGGFEAGKKTLDLLPARATPTQPLVGRNAFITGGLDHKSLDLYAWGKTEQGRTERDEFLSQSARWAAEKRLDFLSAMEAVRRGENVEFEKERAAILAGNQKFHAHFLPGIRSMEIDLDMVKHVQEAMVAGKIPDNVFPEVQRFAALSNFQPAARTTLPMGLGYYQAPFIGEEILPSFVGGADERAAWPAYGFEKFDGSVRPAGIGGQPGESDLVITWSTVNLDVYPRTVNIDRRSRDASVTLPEGLDTTAAEQARVQVQTTKEKAIASFMMTTGNYKDSTHYTTLSGTSQWSHASGTPLTGVPNAMAHIRKAIRTWPDLFALSADAFIAIRRNPQVLTAVQYTGTLARPGQMVPIETIIALFGMSVVVGESGGGVLPDGSDVDDIWGQDAFVVATGKGKVIAPRFGALITAGGYPVVRMWPREDRGAKGSDAITFTEAWNTFSVAKGAAYWFEDASAVL